MRVVAGHPCPFEAVAVQVAVQVVAERKSACMEEKFMCTCYDYVHVCMLDQGRCVKRGYVNIKYTCSIKCSVSTCLCNTCFNTSTNLS